MRRMYLPLTVLGLGGLGVVLFGTRRGRELVSRGAKLFENLPQHLEDWNAEMESEINSLQAAVESVAELLERKPATSNP